VTIDWTLLVFLVTYAGVALGHIPPWALDRTGFALLGAIAMVVSGALTIPQAVAAVDLPTILLLYALMIVSSQLRLGGFYTWTVLRLTRYLDQPRLFLALVMLVSGALSALLTNDIVCLAFTPVLVVAACRRQLNPVPFLLGLAAATNIGSAATIIGNPQNMLIGQLGRLHFGRFAAWCAPPSLVALAAAFGFICWVYRKRFGGAGDVCREVSLPEWPEFNRWQTTKGLLVVGALLLLFFTPVPRELSAIALAGVLLCSRRMGTRRILGLLDWHLLTLFVGLFIVIQGLETTGWPARVVAGLAAAGIDLRDLALLTGVSTVLSNLVSNVPATMLLTRFLDPAAPAQWYALAVSSTFAGNLITIGSIANLIVIEGARSLGIAISFREHARVGVPVTALSLAILLGWIWVAG
jgi:Na+/H+ antiporter NhaD/arsenite permease-like protein